MVANDTYNFYDQSRLVRIDHVDNFNEFIDFEEVDEENSDT